jgi:hypothetical protein
MGKTLLNQSNKVLKMFTLKKVDAGYIVVIDCWGCSIIFDCSQMSACFLFASGSHVNEGGKVYAVDQKVLKKWISMSLKPQQS